MSISLGILSGALYAGFIVAALLPLSLVRANRCRITPKMAMRQMTGTATATGTIQPVPDEVLPLWLELDSTVGPRVNSGTTGVDSVDGWVGDLVLPGSVVSRVE